MRGRTYRFFVAALAVAAIVAGWISLPSDGPKDGIRYRLSTVKRSDLKISTIATGRLEAVDAVQVSSQLSGQVVKLYANFNDKVDSGAPLAQLDDKMFKATVAESQARLANANASYQSALAKIEGAKARAAAARADFQRKTALKKEAAYSTQEIDKARADMLATESALNAARADKAAQMAAIEEAKASLRQARINLDRTIIRSPIAGIVINRSVELGQTVTVSMQAPTLFTIARDLSHLRVYAIVDEADIGRIRQGQDVEFSVDAYPNRTFVGQVIEIHRTPKIVQNVVTYTVVTTAENSDLALLPGMTAIVHIVTTDRPGALLIPNAALRFQPEVDTSVSAGQAKGRANGRGRADVWVSTSSGGLSRVQVSIGASNGSMTEVISGPLSEGQAVAVGRQVRQSERRFFGIHLGF